MDTQDQELLDKQLRNLHVPPRRDGVVIATIIAVFLGGIIIGGALAVPHAADSEYGQSTNRIGSRRRAGDRAAIIEHQANRSAAATGKAPS